MNGDAPHFLRPPPLVTAIPWNYHTHCGGTLFLLSQRLHCGDEKLHRLQKFHAVRERWPPIEVIVTSARGHIGADDLPERGRYLPSLMTSTLYRRFSKKWRGPTTDQHLWPCELQRAASGSKRTQGLFGPPTGWGITSWPACGGRLWEFAKVARRAIFGVRSSIDRAGAI
jgi:hypothetical protein